MNNGIFLSISLCLLCQKYRDYRVISPHFLEHLGSLGISSLGHVTELPPQLPRPDFNGGQTFLATVSEHPSSVCLFLVALGKSFQDLPNIAHSERWTLWENSGMCTLGLSCFQLSLRCYLGILLGAAMRPFKRLFLAPAFNCLPSTPLFSKIFRFPRRPSVLGNQSDQPA